MSEMSIEWVQDPLWITDEDLRGAMVTFHDGECPACAADDD